MHFLIFSQSILSFGIFFFICFIFGQFFINFIEKFYQGSGLRSVNYLKPVLGYGIIIIISYYLYINLNLLHWRNNIYFCELIICYISYPKREKKNFF